MDDVLTSASTIEEAMVLRQQLSQLLQKGRFYLRKWRSNDNRILADLTEDSETDCLLKIEKEGALKTLGLRCDAKSDTLQYSVTIEEPPKVTKRLVLSRIAQIFDPLDLLGPVVINAKHIMQQLWQSKSDWDEPLEPELQKVWNQYYHSLPKINEVRIPRNVNPNNVDGQFDLMGFGDASEKALGIAPLKKISLPRLELNAALLLARLCEKAQRAYGEKIRSTHLWSDSTIVLSWIATSPSVRKTYVANRITKIQDLTREAVWLHVPSKDNRADLISRGMTVTDWGCSKLWWHGPAWITTKRWPQPKQIEIDMSETRASVVLTSVKKPCDLLRRYSSYERLQRTIAYCLRFKVNALGGKLHGPLTVEELGSAERTIARMTQQECFEPELRALKNNQSVPKGSQLATLGPFVEKDGLIRVGGRLSHADLPKAQKHPVLLPARHHITTVLMRKEHVRLLQCGPEQLLWSLRQRYWPLSGRREARKTTNSCLECYRRKPKTPEVFMGDLPSERVRGSLRPFTNSGVDYAELTTESFLAALRRFTARRGICSQMVSDNGTNFVGAARELREIYEFLKKEQQTIADHMARQKMKWKFIPPRSPHFGGLWEAAVKATKRHLTTVTKGLIATFEKYYTLLTKIESILNSRPLTPLSCDPNDVSALTPAHFLVGDSLLLPAEYNYVSVPDHRLSRWRHLQKVRQHFCNRWQKEYLLELQKRHKWYTKSENVKIGTLVLIKDQTPPLHWILGRIVEVHPGADDVVRVATIKTPSGLIKRAVKSLCPLPIEESDII
ncbi:PREDICTED: uncharacterized protein LOC105557117 [Vollenhovia emeryi]|uniref:uncharacterized protein LOC105557117 n=1 Tax=Vollenhovia emeryi TaxID=411798 RepID=UPI0005F47AFB|nr:PREDICTED: uncharacterized protein LOC105557117 [Vollenhovia emeryi]